MLDALQALDEHLPSIIVVGAQAIYLHTDTGDYIEPPMTTDADLALDVGLLGSEPEITGALRNAGFRPGKNPGSWLGTGNVAVDIMVVPSQSGRTSKTARAARLHGHADTAARITPGLEPALVDHAPHALTALDPGDRRRINVNIAGPAALLVAKAIKIEERFTEAGTGMRRRVKEKDALDILRLLQTVETTELVAGLQRHLAVDGVKAVALRALGFLKEAGVAATSDLPALAAAAAAGDPTVAPSFAALMQQLIAGIEDVR
ncbi:hypothetical protein [Mycolicibacter algericus]|uniref:hypothetical protein n=2 Tax=Mycolicibacter algericus TaxID=1288388 RepID=UPI003C772F5E